MSETVALALLAALVLKFTDFLKHLSARDWSAATTQMIAWVSGWLGVILIAATSLAARIIIYGIHLDSASWQEKLLLGLMITSTGSVVYDFKRAFDTTDSAAMPALLPNAIGRGPRIGYGRATPGQRIGPD